MLGENGELAVTPAPVPASYALAGSAGWQADAPYDPAQTPGQPVLTVGPGCMYQTIGAAVAAAVNGDLILVTPGTYVNDFADVTAQVTIAGAGGTVNIVATQSPPNEKGIFVTDASVEIDNISFQGAAISDDLGGNAAGIRYQGGALVLHNDSFIGNQDGLLANAVDGLPVNTIAMQNCTFDDNGDATGLYAGYTHNLYVGTGVTQLTATDNVFERANIGHEFKSRALSNLISGNVFYDGPAGTASYDIDLPNGGADTVSGNIIEKGPDASNGALIHFGGEGIPYAGSSLLVEGNRLINDLGSLAVGVLNQTTLNVAISGNEFDNFEGAAIAQGAYEATGNVDEHGDPIADSSSNQFAPGTDVLDFSGDDAPHSVVLTSSDGVLGGGGVLSVQADAGHVTVVGGTGGLIFQEAQGYGGSDIQTASGASDLIAVSGQDDIESAGQDSIIGGTGNLTAQIDGAASIASGSGNNAYIVNGAASITGGGGGDTVQVNSGSAWAQVNGAETYLQATVSGGRFGCAVSQGGAAEQMTVCGGASATQIYDGAMHVTTAGGGAGSVITFGAGAATVVSAGDDTIQAGSGAESVIVSQSARITAGSGALSVYGRSEGGQASVYGAGGTVTIGGDSGGIAYFGSGETNVVDAALDRIVLTGGAGRMVVAGGSDQTVTGGAGGLVFTSAGGGDLITTQALAHDTIAVAQASTIVSNGNDAITMSGGNGSVVANGRATITGSTGNARYVLNGADSLTCSGGAAVTVAGADAVVSRGTMTCVAVSGAGTLAFSQMAGPDREAATVTGAGAVLSADGVAGVMGVTLGGGADGAVLGAGHDSVLASAVGAHLWTGTGADSVSLSHGGDQIHAGAGSLMLAMDDWLDASVTTVWGGAGALTEEAGCGNLSFIGGKGSAVLGGVSGFESVQAGSGNISLTGGGAGTDFVAGSGSACVSLTSAGGTVVLGSDGSVVTEAGWGGADVYQFEAGHGGGSDVIDGFRTGADRLVFQGVSVSGSVVVQGTLDLTLSDGTHVALAGVSALSGLPMGHAAAVVHGVATIPVHV